MTLVPSPTEASWISPVESYAGDHQKLVLDGRTLGSWGEVRRKRRAIAYRNGERSLPRR